MATTMQAADGAVPTTQGPDRMAVWFPPRLTDDAERPFFLAGSTRRPVAMWRWTSTPDRVEEGAATGLGKFTAQAAGAAGVTSAARYEAGQWQLQLTRALAPADTTRGPRFAPGRAVPVAFFAADGSSGEDEVRGAVSSWYAIHLDVPTPRRVFVAPIAAMLLTAGLGSVLVRQAQRREHRNGGRGSNPEE
jgi:DMSO reductase family type II enzyme heme b subunit